MIGIDEVGRGSLIGEVFACAVYFEDRIQIEVKDSKLLSPVKRLALYNKIINSPNIKYAVCTASLEEIEKLNILQATMLAMERAYNKLNIQCDVKIDGNSKPKNLSFAECVIKGDQLIPQISAASIIAKVERDKKMEDLHQIIPKYEIHNNKGYGTKKHFEAIKKFGLSKFHRKGWKY